MARTYRFVVGPKETNLRLDLYLVCHLPRVLSRTAVQRAIEGGMVSVDGRIAKAHQHVRSAQAIVARFGQLPHPSRDIAILPEPIPLDVVYEDEACLVVNKPAGLVTHPAPGHWSGTLVNAVLWHLRNAECGMWNAESKTDTSHSALRTPHLPRAGIVHRLDKDTSGLLVVAKKEFALRALAKQLKARMVSRRYLALVEGHVPFDEGTIDASIGRHLRDRKLMSVRYLGGRKAVTRYRVLKRCEAQGSGLRAQGKSPQPPAHSPERFRYSVLEITLETGRTHQIRVHLAHLGHPVLGDMVYGRRCASSWSALGIRRQLLHAYAIRFIHPMTEEPIELKAPVPEDMRRWVSPELLQRHKL